MIHETMLQNNQPRKTNRKLVSTTKSTHAHQPIPKISHTSERTPLRAQKARRHLTKPPETAPSSPPWQPLFPAARLLLDSSIGAGKTRNLDAPFNNMTHRERART